MRDYTVHDEKPLSKSEALMADVCGIAKRERGSWVEFPIEQLEDYFDELLLRAILANTILPSFRTSIKGGSLWVRYSPWWAPWR